jgi:hypothetical protein
VANATMATTVNTRNLERIILRLSLVSKSLLTLFTR